MFPTLRGSALADVRRSPRFLALMGVMLIAAVAYGGRDTARLEYTTELSGNASGIGLAAAIFTAGLAVGGLVGGPLSDRFDSRRILVVGLFAQGLANLAMAAVLASGATSLANLASVTVVDGLFAGASIPSMLKSQAGLVPVTARGSAEIVSILRLGVGGVVGVVLAGMIPSPTVTLIAAGLILCAIAFPVGWIVGAVEVTRATRLAGAGILETLRAHPVLRHVVIADLVLCVVIPTQYTNVVLADRQDESLVTPALVGGIVGVLVGRLVLALTGARGDVRLRLLLSQGGFVAVACVGVVAVASGAAYASGWVPAAILFLGSSLTAYGQGMLAALVQQQVPDEVRGRLSGAMAAARSLLMAGSAVLLTALIVPFSATIATVGVAVLALVAIVVLRGFRGISADPVEVR